MALGKKEVQDLIDAAISAAIGGLPSPYLQLIAFQFNVDTQNTGSSTVGDNATIGSNTHVATLVLYKYVSGTVGTAIIKLKTSAGDITPTTLLGSVATQQITEVVKGKMTAGTNALQYEITVGNGVTGIIDIYVYGVLRP